MVQLADAQLIIDTDIVVDYLRGREATLEAALLRYECAITAICLYELLAVRVRSPRQEGLIEQLRSVVSVLPFNAEAATFAAQVWRELGAQGLSIGLPDTLVVGTCLAHRLPLLTRNTEHFQRVPGLAVLAPDEIV